MKRSKSKRYNTVVLGAGPAGLGAGQRLHNGGEASWEIFEATGRVGGLASSRIDKNGFTWDLGGHVLFSKSAFFNSLVKKTLGDSALIHKRESFIKMNGRFIPFPLQYNIHRLPKRAMEDCLAGLVEIARASGGKNKKKPQNFEQWIYAKLGAGMAKHFMLPYNKKLWTVPLTGMGFGWVGDRVALPPVESVKRSIKSGRDETGWGGNATFRFPLTGGTGALFEKIAEPFMQRIAFRHEAQSIDPKKKTVCFKNGKSVNYKKLITTMPLDHLIKNVLANPPPEVVRAAGELRYNSGWMVGIGINKKVKSGRCWVYFPDNQIPFYRVTYFSNYSPHNVAKPGTQSSFLCETSFSPNQKITGSSIVEATIDSLVQARLISKGDTKKIAAKWKIKIERLYPIPAKGRDAALTTIHGYLKSCGIKSIGRFGGWRYEAGNMDHSFMAGHLAGRLCRRTITAEP